MADKARQSNIVMGDRRSNYNRGMWVSATRSVQTSVADSSKDPKHYAKLQEERQNTAKMKAQLQSSSLVLGSANDDERTWKSHNSRKPYTRAEQDAARGQLDPVVAGRLKKSK